MKLGILVNTDRHLEDIVGLTQAALEKGHEVNIFVMDAGTRLLGNSSFSGLCKTAGVRMSFCDHSTKQLQTETEEIPQEIICGSQYDNAVMNHDSDKVIVL